MDNKFLQGLKNDQNYTYTENGGVTHKTTNSYVLDYFSQGSAFRNRSIEDIVKVFSKSYATDPLLTMKILFNSRDVRGGNGERKVFRNLINWMAKNETETMRKNIANIPFFGRWDDLYALFDTPLENEALALIKKQLDKDINTDTPSLLGKWLKSENASSIESKELAARTRKALGMSPKQYRKMLSSLRRKIDILETKLTEVEYSKIDYDKIPSKAGLKYKQAFLRHDATRYEAFIEQVNQGKKKINTQTLFPYEVIRDVMSTRVTAQLKALEAMWYNLPDYIGDNDTDTIAVVDVSGSMWGTPIQMAISLGLYLAERNKGAFRNHFITFSSNPQLVEVVGNNLKTKVENIERADWGGSTNIDATFDLILNTAIKNNLSQDEIPSRIVIISDMEFDSAEGNSYWSTRNKKTNFDLIKEKFKRNGYEMPKLIFWNVDSRNDNAPMTMNERGVQLVSGASPRLFEYILQDKFLSAYDLMLEVLNQERYNIITV